MTALGLPGWLYLTTRDPLDHLLLAALAERTASIKEQERKALAVDIANAVGRLFK